MNWGGPEFVLAIIALSTGGWLINNWIRARHGYALEDEWGGKTSRADHAANAALKAENADLKQALAQVEQRMRVLETIVTDKGFDTAVQIEALRAPSAIAASSAGKEENV